MLKHLSAYGVVILSLLLANLVFAQGEQYLGGEIGSVARAEDENGEDGEWIPEILLEKKLHFPFHGDGELSGGSVSDSNDFTVRRSFSQTLPNSNGARELRWSIQAKPNSEDSPISDIISDIDFLGVGIKPFEYEYEFPKSNWSLDQAELHLLILRLKQKSGRFKYGAEYRYVGPNLKWSDEYKKLVGTNLRLNKDQEVAEVWGSRRIGPVDTKVFFSQSQNNVNHDPKRSIVSASQGGITVDYKIPNLPFYLTLSSSQRMSGTSRVPQGSRPENKRHEVFGGSLYYYGGDRFDMTFSSEYTNSADRFDRAGGTEFFWHDLTASIRPTWDITITPTLSFGEYRDLSSGGRAEYPSASMSIYYSDLFGPVDLSAWGNSSWARSTDGWENSRTVNTSVGLYWQPRHLRARRLQLSFEMSYDSYIDEIYRSSSYSGFSGILSFEIDL